MDAETKEYLDGRFAEILTAFNGWVNRLAQPVDTPHARANPMDSELGDRILSLEDRFQTMKMRMDMLETRVKDRLDAMDRRLRDFDALSRRQW